MVKGFGLGVRLRDAISNATTDPKCSSGLAEDNKTFLELFLPHSANLAADSKKSGSFKGSARINDSLN